jgi:NAD-dependent SIR2 family protein deacetylase
LWHDLVMKNKGFFTHAAELIEQSDGIIIAAGAGIGVDSGLPDFRGNQGFWMAYPALAKTQISFHEIASPRSFLSQPRLAWGFYGHRLALYRQTVPHAGFGLMLKWASHAPLGYTVFTSNVDGQFQKAGFDAHAIHECHGSLHHLQCSADCGQGIWPADGFNPEVDEEQCLLMNDLPTCPQCGALARPNVLMFGDWNWLEARQKAQQMQQRAWLAKVSRPVVIELGAGEVIPSVRHFSQQIVTSFGGRLIRINPRDYSVPTPFDVGLPMGALEGLTGIEQIFRPSGTQLS